MDFLQSLLDNSSVPVITAFILGILTAISPCPLATNITAIGFIGKDIENRHRIFINGLLYTFGRIVTYTVLGGILIPVLREGASMYMVQKAVSKYGEMLIAPVLILVGIFMLDIIKLIQSPNQKIPDRKTKCVIETHLNIKQNVIFGANLKPV